VERSRRGLLGDSQVSVESDVVRRRTEPAGESVSSLVELHHQRWHDTARRIVAGVLVRFVQARDVVINGGGRIRGDLATANAAARNLGFERALGRLGADQGRATRAVARVVLPAVGVYDLVCLFIGYYDVET